MKADTAHEAVVCPNVVCPNVVLRARHDLTEKEL
jgi:hypothetical protein